MTLPNGTKTATEIIADLRGTVCDNQGNRLKKPCCKMLGIHRITGLSCLFSQID